MSLAFYASPIDFKNNDLDVKLKEEKNKISRNMLTEMKTSIETSPTTISDIHKNLKVDNDNELSNFYKSEQSINLDPAIKSNYLLVETTGQNNIQPIEIRVNQCINVINTVLNYFNNI